MADKSVIFTLIAKDAASGAIRGVDRAMGDLKSTGSGLGGVLGGIGGALTSLPALIGGAGVTAAFIGMATAAAEDEAAQRRLLTAIQANDTAWDGLTGKLDTAIEKGQSLGFGDDAVRDSLTTLVTSTKDAGEATRLNGLAMDFARLKGIPLADAAALIGKVHDGNIGILSRYGIEVGKGATVTEALAAMQAAAAGQAEAYGATTAGQMDTLGIKFGELGESVGAIFLPVLTGAVQVLNDVVVPAISSAIEMVAPLMTSIGNALKPVGDLFGALFTGGTDAKGAVDGFGQAIAGIGPKIAEWLKGLLQGIGEAIGQIVPKIAEMAAKFIDWVAPLIPPLLAELVNFMGSMLGWIVAQVPVVAAKLVEWAGAFIGWIGPHIPDILIELGKMVAAIGAWIIRDALPTIATWAVKMGGKLISGFIDALGGLGKALTDAIASAFNSISIDIGPFHLHNGSFSVDMPKMPWDSSPTGHATGGYAVAGTPYIVGERGPELFIPKVSGTVVANGAMRGGGGIQIGSVTVNANGSRGFDAKSAVRDFYDQLDREGRRRGYVGIGSRA